MVIGLVFVSADTEIENNMACLLCLMRDYDDAQDMIRKTMANCDDFCCPFERMTEEIHNNASIIEQRKKTNQPSKREDFHFFILV